MISRATAEYALTQTTYELLFAAPSKSAFAKGVRMPIYFADGPHKWYPYGENGKVDGYIAPYDHVDHPEVISRKIGYRGSISLFSRDGTERR